MHVLGCAREGNTPFIIWANYNPDANPPPLDMALIGPGANTSTTMWSVAENGTLAQLPNGSAVSGFWSTLLAGEKEGERGGAGEDVRGLVC